VACAYICVVVIERELMAFVETIAFASADKIFLVVADFNPKARHFYERLGYQQTGELPSLYRNGVTEYLMIKRKDEKSLSLLDI